MKAVVARAFGPLEQLVYEDWPEPEAGPDQVVIETDTIGVNFPDGLLVQGLYQIKPTTPFIPGMEVAGHIIAVGRNVTSLKVGQRVVGLATMGTYAERVALPESAVLAIDENMNGAHACAMLCAYGTSCYALMQRAQLGSDETLCVLGAGGATGIAAIQIAKAMGSRVIAVASSPDKQSLARDAGADIVLGYDNLKDSLKEATGKKGVDVAFDPVGGEAFDALSRAMAWNGRLLVIGFASGTIPKLPVNLTLVKGYSVVGVFWGSFIAREPLVQASNMKTLFGWYDEGKIRPVIEGEYPLRDAGEILARVLGRKASGKLVLKP